MITSNIKWGFNFQANIRQAGEKKLWWDWTRLLKMIVMGVVEAKD